MAIVGSGKENQIHLGNHLQRAQELERKRSRAEAGKPTKAMERLAKHLP